MPDSSSSKKRVAGLSTSQEAEVEEEEPRATVRLHLGEDERVRLARDGERVAVQSPYENRVTALREAVQEALSRVILTDLEAAKLPNGRGMVVAPAGGAQFEAASSSLRAVASVNSVGDDQHMAWPLTHSWEWWPHWKGWGGGGSDGGEGGGVSQVMPVQPSMQRQ
jgi:hypothetical protein